MLHTTHPPNPCNPTQPKVLGDMYLLCLLTIESKKGVLMPWVRYSFSVVWFFVPRARLHTLGCNHTLQCTLATTKCCFWSVYGVVASHRRAEPQPSFTPPGGLRTMGENPPTIVVYSSSRRRNHAVSQESKVGRLASTMPPLPTLSDRLFLPLVLAATLTTGVQRPSLW